MIAVALSGGADSAFTAYLLRQRHEVFGLFALLAQADPEREIARVRKICQKLSIPLEVVDLREIFHQRIIGYFKEAYRQAKTPNPCIVCNREIKFGLLLEKALNLGAEKLATGHYVRLFWDGEHECYLLQKGVDPAKDQSYFLALLRQEQLEKAVFPLGTWRKREVIREAVRLGLFELTAPESQEVCFIRGDYRELFKDEDFPPGEIVTLSGRVVGRHRGLFAYTIGQRRGLGVRLGRPYYVVALDPERNRVIIGPKRYLARRELLVERPHLVCPRRGLPERALVRVRYRHQEAPACLEPQNGLLKITFQRPQQAITPGQFAVFYDGELVLGGGEICRIPEG